MPRSTLPSDRRPRAAALAVVLVFTAGPALGQQPASGDPAPVDSIEVVAIEFRGREALDGDVIEEAISTHATSCRSPLALALCRLGLDVVRRPRWLDTAQVVLDADRIATVYEIHGYPGTTVSAQVERKGHGARVVFTIDEAAPFVVETLTLEGLPDGVPLPGPLPLQIGEPYSLPALDASLERIEFLLARHGYPYATVEVHGRVDEARRRAEVRLVALPGASVTFGTVSILADDELDPDAVADRVAARAGDPYDPLLLERTERALYDLEAIGRAIVRVDGLAERDTVLPIIVDVSAGRLRGLEAEGTVSTTDCFEAAGFWTHRHLGGRPRVVRLGATASNLLASQLDGSFPCSESGTAEYARIDYHGALSLDEPIPGTAETWARLELFAERTSSPDVFIERGFGVTARLSRHPDQDLGFAIQYGARRFDLSAVELYLCGNYGACERDAFDRLAGPAWLAPLTASIVWMSDGELQGVTREKLALWRLEELPRFRAEFRGAIEAAGGWSLSDFRYRRALAQAAATRRFGDGVEIAARLRGGFLHTSEPLPPRVRLFSGGPGSVRAVPQNLLGPATLVADPRDLDRIGCAPAPDGCPANSAVRPDLVRLRPLGGRHLVEAAVEARYDIAARAQTAAFVDFGWLSSPRDEAGSADWIIAPGVGIRLVANIGAIRVDLAVDPRGPRTLPIRSAPTVDGEIQDLGMVRYDPFTHDGPGLARELWRRMQLHFAIGQAF